MPLKFVCGRIVFPDIGDIQKLLNHLLNFSTIHSRRSRPLSSLKSKDDKHDYLVDIEIWSYFKLDRFYIDRLFCW
jgi:hypothetical protein